MHPFGALPRYHLHPFARLRPQDMDLDFVKKALGPQTEGILASQTM